MKRLLLISAIIASLSFIGCAPVFRVEGDYSNASVKGIAGDAFRFTRAPDLFQYFSRVEGSTIRFSAGSWAKSKKKIFLHGFDDTHIALLNIETSVADNKLAGKDKIIIHYRSDSLDLFTKLELCLNANCHIQIFGDTVFFVDKGLKSLTFKSYLSHENILLRADPYIDTLYSPEIKIGSSEKYISAFFDVMVSQKDFYRINLSDTLIRKNERTLIWKKKEYKKIKTN